MKTKTYGLQQETRQYLRRLYTYGRELRGEDIADIDEFIKGCKVIGVWDKSIFWLMRRQYNIGTGSTMLCLTSGGEKPDATLLNAATWSDNGIVRAGASQIDLYSTPLKFLDKAPISYGIVTKQATDLGNNAAYWFTASTNTAGRQFAISNAGAIGIFGVYTYRSAWATGGPSVNNVAGPARTSPQYVSWRLNGPTTGRVSINTTMATSSGGSWDASVPAFTRFGAYLVAPNLTASMSFLRSALITDEQDANLYKLLKVTVCKNLGLN